MQNSKSFELKTTIYSFLLFVLGCFLGLYLAISVFKFENYSFSFLYLVWILALVLVHEMTHFLGYLIIARLKYNEIRFVWGNKKELPHFQPTVNIDSRTQIIINCLPLITVPIAAILILFITNNYAYFVLLGISLGLSGGDVVMCFEGRTKPMEFVERGF